MALFIHDANLYQRIDISKKMWARRYSKPRAYVLQTLLTALVADPLRGEYRIRTCAGLLAAGLFSKEIQ